MSHTVVGSLDTCNVTGLPTPIRSLAAEGATDAAVFEAYMERILLPALGPGQVMVMDNLTAHSGLHGY